MFRTSSRSISGLSRRHGLSCLAPGAANLRQFHYVPAVRSEAVNEIKQDANSAETSVQFPDKQTNKRSAESQASFKTLNPLTHTGPSQPSYSSKTPRKLQQREWHMPDEDVDVSLLSPKACKELVWRTRRLAEHALDEFKTVQRDATDEDLADPNKKAEILQLGDRAMEYFRRTAEVQNQATNNLRRLAKETEKKVKEGDNVAKRRAERLTAATEQLARLTKKAEQRFGDLRAWRTKMDREMNTTVGAAADEGTAAREDSAAKEDTAVKEDTAAKEDSTAEENSAPKKNNAAKENTAPKKNSIAKNNTGANDNSATKENSGLDLSSKVDIVTQILESSSRNAPALPQADAQKTEGRTNEQSQKETLGHIAKHIETKERGQLSSKDSGLIPLDAPMPPVPGVSFGLDRVLFNPGVYHLRDPRSRVYNFDPYLGEIMPVTEFDFNALKPYITSSKDVMASEMAAKENKKYYGSSSSMTSALSHFHYLLSAWRPIDCRTVSQGFSDKLRSFTRLLRAPTAMFVHYKEKEDIYAIDADKEFDNANILMNLGKSMEKLLTLPKEEFERYRRSSANKITPEEESSIPESYHYTSSGKFLMRSQLDAYDPRLPGTGMYDLKTRAVVSIRMDSSNHETGMGYEIKDRYGLFESYEREYFDMMRAAFLKYSLQVRVGRMDGIFVAYHNIQRIFGFQYISLSEMDQTLHGQTDTALGDKEFELSLGLWEKVLDKATAKFPKQSLRFHFETRDAATPFMYIFAQPVTDEQIHAIQTKNQAEVQAMQDRLLNPEQFTSKITEPEEGPSDATPGAEISEDQPSQPDEDDENVLAMTLLTRNKVNGEPVDRPMDFRSHDTWTVDYELNELNPKQGNTLLKMCKRRRAAVLEKTEDDADNADRGWFLGRLKNLAEEGRKFRERENKKDRQDGIVVFEDSRKSS